MSIEPDHPRVFADGPPSPSDGGRVAVIDIGSNTVRLVVFDGRARVPIPLFNEKAGCGLGRDLAATGRLHPQGVVLAREALTRYRHLTRSMGLARVDLVATAAVRDAGDGPGFARWVGDLFATPVQVLSGIEEARLSGLGVLCGAPHADGVVGDLGGGSLDMVALDDGRFGAAETLTLGHLRLGEESGGDRVSARKLVAARLAELPWLAAKNGETLYAVGGAWRAMARIFIEHTNYPLHIIDRYTIPRYEAAKLSELIAGLGRSSLEKIESVSRRRMDALPFAAIALDEMIKAVRPRRIVFSSYGMREGKFLEGVPADLRQEDPLIAACAHIAENGSRFGAQGWEIFEWTTPLFPDEDPRDRRIRLAACLLSDIAWYEHPDYRADHAFQRVLRLPFAGLSHRDRVLMAFAIGLRHGGERQMPTYATVRALLPEPFEKRGRAIGAALRLANTLSGGVPGLLPRTTLRRDGDMLFLDLPEDGVMFRSDVIERRLDVLARALGLKR